MFPNLIFMFSGALILAFGYELCYHRHIKRAKSSEKNMVLPKPRAAFVVPDKRNQLETAEKVVHKPTRYGKIEPKE